MVLCDVPSNCILLLSNGVLDWVMRRDAHLLWKSFVLFFDASIAVLHVFGCANRVAAMRYSVTLGADGAVATIVNRTRRMLSALKVRVEAAMYSVSKTVSSSPVCRAVQAIIRTFKTSWIMQAIRVPLAANN